MKNGEISHGVGDTDLLGRFIEMGMRFILAGNDFSFIMTGARQRAESLRTKG